MLQHVAACCSVLQRVWVVGEFVDVMKMWVTLFHFCWRCHFQPLPFSNLSFSPTSFPRFTHLQISPTCRFHLLAHFIYLHLSCVMISIVCVRLHVIFTHCFLSPVVPQKSIFTHDSLHSGFTHLTCRFHLLANFIYLHLSCVMFSVVSVRLHVIFTHCFLSPDVPQKWLFTHDALRCGFTHQQISPTCRFHPPADFTYL